jgi:hypothetical protein
MADTRRTMVYTDTVSSSNVALYEHYGQFLGVPVRLAWVDPLDGL